MFSHSQPDPRIQLKAVLIVCLSSLLVWVSGIFFMMEESTPVLLEDLQKTEFTKNKIKSTSQRRRYSEINPCVLAKDQKLYHASHNATGGPNVLSVKTDHTISDRYNGIIKKKNQCWRY